MSEISRILLPSGTTYYFRDDEGRNQIKALQEYTSGAMHYVGVSTTALVDGSTTNPITIKDGSSTKSYTATAGDVVQYGSLEFIWSSVTSSWAEFGSTGSLKKLAFKDTASATYKPSGTVSSTFTGTKATISSSFTPSGTVSGNTTAKGTNAASAVTITPKTTSVYSITGVGAVAAGSAAKCTLPKLTTKVSDETLIFGWTDGSFTANTPTAVTLPTRSQVSGLWNGYSAATAAAQTFTGASSAVNATFSGTAGTATATYTPSGSVSSSFTGVSDTITVS